MALSLPLRPNYPNAPFEPPASETDDISDWSLWQREVASPRNVP